MTMTTWEMDLRSTLNNRETEEETLEITRSQKAVLDEVDGVPPRSSQSSGRDSEGGRQRRSASRKQPIPWRRDSEGDSYTYRPFGVNRFSGRGGGVWGVVCGVR